MTDRDLDFVEGELGVTLPAAYRRTLSEFPVRACAGNSDTELWDDASALVSRNRALRAGEGGVAPWQRHQYFIGGGAGWSNAIDLRKPNAPVWLVEADDWQHADTGIDYEAFEEWAAAYVADQRQALVAEGVNPAGTPAERIAAQATGRRRRGRSPAVVILLGALALGFIAMIMALKR